MKPSTHEWVKKAEADYQLALALSRRRKVTFHDHGCFCCQQSAEKYLKARLDLLPLFQRHLIEAGSSKKTQTNSQIDLYLPMRSAQILLCSFC